MATFNLSALGERLFAEKRHLALAGKIKEMVRYHSLRTDLIMAEETCEALADLLGAKSTNPRQAIVETALLSNAIVLYARATSTSSNERAPFSLEPFFNENQKVVHREMVDLRNDAIAHYGSGGSYADQGMWKAEVGIMHMRETDGKVGVATRRLTVDRQLFERVQSQIMFARVTVERIYAEKCNLVTDEIDRVSEVDPDIDLEIGKHPMNLDVFLASKEAGDQARESFDTGYTSGVASHR